MEILSLYHVKKLKNNNNNWKHKLEVIKHLTRNVWFLPCNNIWVVDRATRRAVWFVGWLFIYYTVVKLTSILLLNLGSAHPAIPYSKPCGTDCWCTCKNKKNRHVRKKYIFWKYWWLNIIRCSGKCVTKSSHVKK